MAWQTIYGCRACRFVEEVSLEGGPSKSRVNIDYRGWDMCVVVPPSASLEDIAPVVKKWKDIIDKCVPMEMNERQ